MNVISKESVLIANSATTKPKKKAWDWDDYSPGVFIMPAILIVLFTSLFPLIISLYLSLSRFKFVKGGFELKYIGWLNYKKLLMGSQQYHFLGTFKELSVVSWMILVGVAMGLAWALFKYARSNRVSLYGLTGWAISSVFTFLLALLILKTIGSGGKPGTMVVTLLYVFGGIVLQYAIGLGLALLCVQPLKGRNFFKVIFFFPLMITPVGIAFLFRMLADPGKGPLAPLWRLFGMAEFSWATDPWGARFAVIMGDTWQWVPFMFIVLVAVLESQPKEIQEAARVDGCTHWELFRYITWPNIIPASIALVLIRMIEAFKIVDLPNIMTNGGPGIASESLTLHSFMAWRALDLGGSAAVGYMLMFLVLVCSLTFLNLLRRQMDRTS